MPFCETLSAFELDNIKNKAILLDSFQSGELRAELMASYQCMLRFVHSICEKCCPCHANMMPGLTKCCTCCTKYLGKPDLMFQNAAFFRKSELWPPNTSSSSVCCILAAMRNASVQIFFTCPTRAIVLKLLQNLHFLLTFVKVRDPLCLPHKKASEHPKAVRTCAGLYILTLKCACYAPQRHALFPHWSAHGVICTV